MRPVVFLHNIGFKRPVSLLFLIVAALGQISPVLAVTPQELQGDFHLTALNINYGGAFPPPLDENDLQPLFGHFSATARTLLFEHKGSHSSAKFEQRTAGLYELAGNVATVWRVDGDPKTTDTPVQVTLQLLSPNTLIVTGAGVDSNSQPYNFTYTFARDETYYSQAQLDAAIEDAAADLFTQEQVDALVAEALENVTPRVVVIPLCY